MNERDRLFVEVMRSEVAYQQWLEDWVDGQLQAATKALDNISEWGPVKVYRSDTNTEAEALNALTTNG